jgi:GT2 family glycosyltransferase
MQNYADRDIVAVAGAVLGPEKQYSDRLPPEFFDPRLRHFCGIWNYNARMEVVHARGANHSFRRPIWELVGGYDESYTGPALREESDFFYRIHALGNRIVYDPDAWLIHVPGGLTGGCWEDFDGVVSAERIYNHAYFLIKHYRGQDLVYLFGHHFLSVMAKRDTLRKPWLVFRKAWRFAQGWLRAFGTRVRQEP